MTESDTTSLAGFEPSLPAGPPFGFHGRAVALQRLLDFARDGVQGLPRELAVCGPPGAGKSELLRECARQLFTPARQFPITIQLPLERAGANFSALSSLRQEEALWQALVLQVLRAVIDRQAPPPAESWGSGFATQAPLDAAALADGGCERLVPWLALAQDPRAELRAIHWTRLLRELPTCGLGAPVVLVETRGDLARDVASQFQLTALRRATQAAFVPLALEWGCGGLPTAEHLHLEVLTLAPLELAEAGALAAAIGQARGWTFGPPVLEPILRRLGPWPGWVLGWAMQVGGAARENPVRYAEEAYVNWLTVSGWSRLMRQAFELACPPASRRGLLRLLAGLPRRGAVSLQELSGLLGLSSTEAARLADGLLAAGLLTRQGFSLAPAAPGAVLHWLELQGEGESEGAGWTPRRLALMARLLGQPRPAAEQPGFEADVHGTLQRLPRLFRGQRVPEVLFDFPNYHEAVGRLSLADRLETMCRATHDLRLPEMIGIASEGPAAAGAAIYSARAYQDGKYQRSHEQTWLVADLSRVRVVTSPEVRHVIEAFRAIERNQGVGRYFRWVIVGEGASAEAIELLRQERVLSSCREQLSMLQEMLEPAAPRIPPREPAQPRGLAATDVPPVEPRESAPVGTFSRFGAEPLAHGASIEAVAPLPVPATGGPLAGADGGPAGRLLRTDVVDMAEAQEDRAPEGSRLSLPARDGSEYIAALMAEKLALRGGFDGSAAGKIKTAVLEGVLNAIEHSPNGEKMIDIDIALDSHGMRIVIENEGAAFDPLAVPAPEPLAKLSAANKRGWGISLMKQFMDEVAYDPCDRGTRLRLYKRREAEAGPQKLVGGKAGL